MRVEEEDGEMVRVLKSCCSSCWLVEEEQMWKSEGEEACVMVARIGSPRGGL